MPACRVFISYRREDSAAHAGRLSDRLVAACGPDRVFMDVDDIQPGQDFGAALRENIAAAGIVLVVIGPRWLAAGEDGRPRLARPQDYVRLEVAEALRAGKRVVPILINGTPMPAAEALPAELQPLALCQAFGLSDTRFDRDMAALVEALRLPTRRDALRRRALAGTALALAAVLGAWQLAGERPRVADEPATAVPAADADIAGTWEGTVFYEWDRRGVTERFRFKPVAGQITGSASFLGVPRGILAVELEGKALAFETRTRGAINDKEVEFVHRYRGEVDGERLHLVMQTTGGYDSSMPREIEAKRISRE